MYIKRQAEEKLQEYLNAFPVVCVTGARQSGKSTLLKHCLDADYTYITMDDFRLRSLFDADPEKFMETYSSKVIIDEVQKVPAIFEYIKRVVDENRQSYGQYILTGSSQLTLMKNLTESLAGRIGLLSLYPFQLSEVPEHLHKESLFKGAYPELVTRDYRLNLDWYSSYVETYINKDVRSISGVGDLRDFKRLVRLLAVLTSQQLNMSTLANEIGVSVPTIKRWISILEATYIIFLLPPYHSNLGKRLVKSPKIYFCDTGLAAYLCGVDTLAAYENGPMAGALFENYMVTEVLKKENHTGSHSELYYFRTNHGAEIDLIIDRRNSVEFIEIKKSMTFKPTMLKHLQSLGKTADKCSLVYSGETFPYEGIEIINYKEYLIL
jgi:predicted AAA+ superfamily ATPase